MQQYFIKKSTGVKNNSNVIVSIDSNEDYINYLYAIFEEAFNLSKKKNQNFPQFNLSKIEEDTMKMISPETDIYLNKFVENYKLELADKYILAMFSYSYALSKYKFPRPGTPKYPLNILSSAITGYNLSFLITGFVENSELFKRLILNYDANDKFVYLKNSSVASYINGWTDDYEIKESNAVDNHKSVLKSNIFFKKESHKEVKDKKLKLNKNSDEFLNLTPEKISEHIFNQKYIGQKKCVRDISIALFKQIYNIVNPNILPRILFLGPTGSGKTFLFETIKSIFNVPLFIYNCNESGFKNADGSTISSSLYEVNKIMKRNKSLTGIIFFDEFDKLSTHSNIYKHHNVKDDRKIIVQEELLSILEGNKIKVSNLGKRFNKNSPITTVDTSKIIIACAGTFSGFNGFKYSNEQSIGFAVTKTNNQSIIQHKINKFDNELPKQLIKYGFMPEIISRFTNIGVFQPHNSESIIKIVELVFDDYKRELNLFNIDVNLSQKVIDKFPSKVLKLETGARAVKLILGRICDKILYNELNSNNGNNFIIDLNENDELYYKSIED